MDYRKIKIISWNVRGLNDKNKRLAVKNFINSENPSLVGLQETKIATLDNNLVKEITGSNLNNYVTLNSIGASGGMLISLNSQIEACTELIAWIDKMDEIRKLSKLETLIAKNNEANKAFDFRPLSLISSIQRIFSKTLANRLSIDGRVMLVNSVLSAIPVYYMSLFKLPQLYDHLSNTWGTVATIQENNHNWPYNFFAGFYSLVWSCLANRSRVQADVPRSSSSCFRER